MRISIVNFSQTVADGANLVIANKKRVACAFRLPELNFTLDFFIDELGSWNGVLCDYVLKTNGWTWMFHFFCAHMHVDNLRSSAYFHPIRLPA